MSLNAHVWLRVWFVDKDVCVCVRARARAGAQMRHGLMHCLVTLRLPEACSRLHNYSFCLFCASMSITSDLHASRSLHPW
jgi:hypothetical protein